MHTTRDDMPIKFQSGGICSRMSQWEEMNAAFETLPAGTDSRQFFKGLPEDRCQCPHWGYLIKGRMRVLYADHEEVIPAGAAFYLPKGHNVIMEEDSEVIEFSPAGLYQKTIEAANRNQVAMNRS
jgi:hypothetical protein